MAAPTLPGPAPLAPTEWGNRWAPVFGYGTPFANPVSGVDEIQIATQATLAVDATVTSITAYIDYPIPQDTELFRFAIYTDAGGEPGTLIAETAVLTEAGNGWKTIALPATSLTAGTYWLALSLNSSDISYRQESSGGETRYKTWEAVVNGYLPTWGTSDSSFPYKVSIYATYTPD